MIMWEIDLCSYSYADVTALIRNMSTRVSTDMKTVVFSLVVMVMTNLRSHNM